MAQNYESIAIGQAIREHDEVAGAKRVSPVNTSGSQVNPATEETLQSLLAVSGGGAYETRVDEVSATVSYIGKATPGAATSAASWQISKLDETTGLILSYADDVTTFTKVWDNRASYTY